MQNLPMMTGVPMLAPMGPKPLLKKPKVAPKGLKVPQSARAALLAAMDKDKDGQ